MKKFKKAAALAALAVVAAAALLMTPQGRAWATPLGAWMFPQLYVYARSTTGGVIVNAGSAASPAALSEHFIGALATSARPACAAGTEGYSMWDTTAHSKAFCNGTKWYKFADSGSAVTWTAY